MRALISLLALGMMLVSTSSAFAQVYGVELHNSMMPASAGMGGASFSQPQDIQSAIYANAATMTQFQGTHFSFGGAWAEPTINMTQTAPLPLSGVTPFQAKSQAPGSMLGNIGIIHSTQAFGRPIKLGLGFKSNAGLAADYRQDPGSNGTHVSLLALDTVASVGYAVNDRLSVGGSFNLGISIMDGPFASASSSQMTYPIRAAFGMNYVLSPGVTIGSYYQSKKEHTFVDVVRFPNGAFQDLDVDLPANIGIGVANNNFMNGRLLLAVDFLYKFYSDAELFSSLYSDQMVLQFGSQYAVNQRLKLRMGYAFNENPMLDSVPGTIGGVIPIGGIPTIQYVQAQFAAVSQHRLTAGVGVRDVMPNVDLDMSVGGMFEASQTFGASTNSIESYWVAFGLTWRYGACCEQGCESCYSPSEVPITSSAPMSSFQN